MSEFHDPELRQQLGRLSGPYPDDNVAFAAWQRRVGQARRRRAVAWTSGAALALVMATVGVAAMQSPTRHTLVPGKSSETSEEVSSSVATTEADDSTTAPTIAETTAPAVVAPETTPSSEVPESSPPETEPGQAAAGQQPGNSNRGPGGPPSTPAPATPQVATKTISSVGGSIIVRQDGNNVFIVSTNPAPGFQAHKSDHSDHGIGLTFTSATHRSVITAKLSDGTIKSEVKESDSRNDSATTDSTGGDHGGSDG
jgi:hypothetical protein